MSIDDTNKPALFFFAAYATEYFLTRQMLKALRGKPESYDNVIIIWCKYSINLTEVARYVK